jgi:hypothetical protein
MRPLLFALVSICAACASTPSARHPSAAGDDAIARANEREAQEHLTSAETGLRTLQDCGPQSNPVRMCWTPNDNFDRAAAEKHMQEARHRRAESQALRDAQARACSGVAEADREVSPFAHVKDIVRVEPLANGPHVLGAKVTFRPVSGLTKEGLQRIVDCHVAEADALGHNLPEETFCPLNPPNVKATVAATQEGFEVTITTDDSAAAKEVLRRAQALRP